jgi:DDE superfamily endonuclease/Helix-turn-helix of DDE superfamily endonuclease
MSILSFEALRAQPGVFKSMTGVSVEEFQAILAQVGPSYQAMVNSRLGRAGRKRAPGGGENSRHDVTERLLMTLVWLRLYLTCEAVGFLFGVNKGTVSRFTRPILLILRDLGVDTLGWPQEAVELAGPGEEGPTAPDSSGDPPGDPTGPEQGPNETDVVGIVTPDKSGCPDHLAIFDATEQRVERPSVYETQKQFYSGKRKAHTIKDQIVVNEHGRIRQVSDSVPGSTHDLTLLRQSGAVTQLPPGVTPTADCGYRGMQNDFPNHSVALPYRPKSGEQLLPEEKLHNHFVSSVRIVVENTLCELKHFQALVARFRHSLERHSPQRTRTLSCENALECC